ncbi:MAG: PLP-dependent aminotransferase family protein [Acidimicrobiales bacterium]
MAAPAPYITAPAGTLHWDGLLAGRGRDVASDTIRDILALVDEPDVISFAGGFPDPATFPRPELHRIVGDLVRDRDSSAFQYAPTQGLESVRGFLADRLERNERRRPAPDELTVTSGAIEALELISLSVLDPGDVVVVEAPTYLGAIMSFRGMGADVVAVPLDRHGLDVERLATLLRRGLRPKLLYTIPDFHNPAGVTMADDRRQPLLALAARYGFPVIEDVAYRELWFEEPPPPSLWSTDPSLVVQIGTFSKVFFPGVRLGWASGPAPLIARMVSAKQNTNQCAGALGQRLLERHGRSGGLDEGIARSRGLYRARRDLLLVALGEELGGTGDWTRPGGGFYSWLTFDDDVDTTALARSARERNVAFVPGEVFYPDGQGRRSLRLAYSLVADDQIATGVQRLAEVVAEVTPR